MLKYEEGVKKPIRELCQKIHDILGLDGYAIVVAPKDSIESGNLMGITYMSHSSLDALINYKSELNGWDLAVTLAHELIHVALAPLDCHFQQRLVTMIPKNQRKLARGLYHDHLEETVERMARALVIHLGIPYGQQDLNEAQRPKRSGRKSKKTQ